VSIGNDVFIVFENDIVTGNCLRKSRFSTFCLAGFSLVRKVNDTIRIFCNSNLILNTALIVSIRIDVSSSLEAFNGFPNSTWGKFRADKTSLSTKHFCMNIKLGKSRQFDTAIFTIKT